MESATTPKAHATENQVLREPALSKVYYAGRVLLCPWEPRFDLRVPLCVESVTLPWERHFALRASLRPESAAPLRAALNPESAGPKNKNQ